MGPTGLPDEVLANDDLTGQETASSREEQRGFETSTCLLALGVQQEHCMSCETQAPLPLFSLPGSHLALREPLRRIEEANAASGFAEHRKGSGKATRSAKPRTLLEAFGSLAEVTVELHLLPQVPQDKPFPAAGESSGVLHEPAPLQFAPTLWKTIETNKAPHRPKCISSVRYMAQCKLQAPRCNRCRGGRVPQCWLSPAPFCIAGRYAAQSSS